MVIFVIVINTLISLTLLYLAWRVWQLKRWIAYIADRLTIYERCSHALLYIAPEIIYTGQQGIQNLRQGNQALQMQIQQVQQIVGLLLLGQRIWQRYFQKLYSPIAKK